MNVSWTIETADYGTLTASGVEGNSLPMFVIGDSISLTLVFGAGLSNHVSDYDSVRKFGRYASESTIDTGTDIRGKPWYRERLHPESTFTSTVVKLNPGDDVGNVESYWVAVTGVEDGTQYVGAGERVTIECFILANGSEYNTRADIEKDLKAEL